MENVNINSNNETEPKAKLIFNANLMKYLIEEKHMADQIIGLKSNRENKDRCVFVCIDSLMLRDAMQEYTKQRRKVRAEREKMNEMSADDEKEPILQED